jgi:hypothetical protein
MEYIALKLSRIPSFYKWVKDGCKNLETCNCQITKSFQHPDIKEHIFCNFDYKDNYFNPIGNQFIIDIRPYEFSKKVWKKMIKDIKNNKHKKIISITTQTAHA